MDEATAKGMTFDMMLHQLRALHMEQVQCLESQLQQCRGDAVSASDAGVQDFCSPAWAAAQMSTECRNTSPQETGAAVAEDRDDKMQEVPTEGAEAPAPDGAAAAGRSGSAGQRFRSNATQKVKSLFVHEGPQDSDRFQHALESLVNQRGQKAGFNSPWHILLRGFRPLGRIVKSPRFEAVIGFLIILNTVIIAVDFQVSGWDRGVKESWLLDPTSTRYGNREPWKSLLNTADMLEMILGFAFVSEVALKFVGLGIFRFLRDPWNILDTVVVTTWLLELAATSLSFGGAIVLRSVRVFRFFRVMRLLKTVGLFDSLFLLHAALKGCAGVLTWSLLYFVLVQITLALAVSQYVSEFYLSSENVPHEDKMEVYQYFGTFSYAVLTMFEMTLANWPPVCRVMMHHLSQWWVVFALFHKLTIGLALVGIINGVVMQETFKAAAQDKDVMVRDKRRQAAKIRHRLRLLFASADEGQDGKLDCAEFVKLCTNPVLKLWLSSIGLNTSDAAKVFHLIANGHGTITADEFLAGVERLRGLASSVDLHAIIRELIDNLNNSSSSQGLALHALEQRISEQSASLKDFTGELSQKLTDHGEFSQRLTDHGELSHRLTDHGPSVHSETPLSAASGKATRGDLAADDFQEISC
mmetsp:Transcript_12343/g.28976  ORF Transcript_12343/g.28976 Transcript_12343/m.28976 type:complete len:640 (+) Transcript_12343:108-2027(+)